VRRGMAAMVMTIVATACGGGNSGSTVATTTATTTTSLTTTAATTTTSAATGTWFDGLAAGVCFDDARTATGSFDFSVPPDIVDCRDAHDNEIVARLPLGDGDFPSGDVAATAADLCAGAFATFFSTSIENTAMSEFNVWPDEADWAAGARDVICAVYGADSLAGTAASAGLTAPGHAIAVLALTSDSQVLWIVDAGTGEVIADLVAGSLAPTGAPSWAPDGSAIAFSAPLGEGDSDIFLASSSGGDPQPAVDQFGLDEQPSIAPVGTAIAYTSDTAGGEFEIYVLDLDAGVTTRLTDNEDRDSAPRWSPDATELAFRRRVGDNADIYVMRADGSDVRRLTTDPGFDGDAVWSPDGEQILFTSDRAGSYDLWLMNPDGSDQRRLTDHPADEEFPSWSSDGRFIAFHTNRHGVEQVWLMRADGSEQSQLIGTTPTGFPAFSPVPLD